MTAPSQPPRTFGGLIRQSREALRRFRVDKAAGSAAKRSAGEPWRLLVQLPIPTEPLQLVPFAPAPTPLERRPFGLLDESDFPGGAEQKLRAVRPLVDAWLEGYDAQYLGALEAAADGVGCWSLADTTVVANVTNATFPVLDNLCSGKYGARPLDPSHTLVVVNAEWSSAADIGQPWDWRLKQRARALIDDAHWEVLYSETMLRTSKGRRHGLLVGAWGAGWQLYAADAGESSSLRDMCLHSSLEPIPPVRAVQLLNEAPE